jgi:hypothetical protein
MKVSTLILFLSLLSQQTFATDPVTPAPFVIGGSTSSANDYANIVTALAGSSSNGATVGLPAGASAQPQSSAQPYVVIGPGGAVFGPGPSGVPNTTGSAVTAGTTDTKAAPAVDPAAACGAIGANYNANGESDELVAAIFAGTLSKDICTAAGKSIPKSLSKWWAALKLYEAGEKARHENFDLSIDALKKQMDAIIADKSGDKNLQVQANMIQISLTNLTIQNINERIKLRTALEEAGNVALKANTKENTEVYDAYKDDLIANGLEKALSIANDACKRKSKQQICQRTGGDQDQQECHEEEVADPVKGCKEAQTQIPALIAGKVHEYGMTYLDMSGPSKDLNEKLGNFEDDMTSAVKAIPTSDDSKYDWSTPMNNGLTAMKKARKNAGAICTSTKDKEAMKKITEALSKFPEATPSMSGDKLTKTFELADMLVGQPYKRGDYLQYFTGHLNYIGCFDQAGKTVAIANLGKLIDFGKAVAAIGSSATGAAAGSTGGSSGGSSGATAAPAKPAVTTITGNNTSQASWGPGSNQPGTTSSPFVIGGSTSNATAPAHATSAINANGTSTTGLTSPTSNTSSTSAGTSTTNAVNAIAKKYAEDNAAANTKFTNLVKATATTKTTTTANGQNAAAPVTGMDMLKKGFDNLNSQSRSGSNQEKSSPNSADEKAVAPEKNYVSNINSNYRNTNASDAYGDNSASSRSSNNRRTTTTDLGYSRTYSSASTGSSKSAHSDDSDSKRSGSKDRAEAARLLNQSIQAKNSEKPGLYLPKDNDSLFDVVSKAYVRNFEKVANDKAE